MRRLFLVVGLVAVGGLAYVATTIALPLYGTDNSSSNTSGTATGSPVMSPSEFSSRVTALKQQTKDNIAQEAKQILSTKPTVPGAGTTTSTDNTGLPTTPDTTTTTTTTTASQPGSTTTYGSNPGANPGLTKQPSSQTYTGFGTGSTSSPSQPQQPARGGSNNNSGGGWNIKY